MAIFPVLQKLTHMQLDPNTMIPALSLAFLCLTTQITETGQVDMVWLSGYEKTPSEMDVAPWLDG